MCNRETCDYWHRLAVRRVNSRTYRECLAALAVKESPCKHRAPKAQGSWRPDMPVRLAADVLVCVLCVLPSYLAVDYRFAIECGYIHHIARSKMQGAHNLFSNVNLAVEVECDSRFASIHDLLILVKP